MVRFQQYSPFTNPLKLPSVFVAPQLAIKMSWEVVELLNDTMSTSPAPNAPPNTFRKLLLTIWILGLAAFRVAAEKSSVIGLLVEPLLCGITVEVIVPENRTESPAAVLLLLNWETDHALPRLVPMPEPAPLCVVYHVAACACESADRQSRTKMVPRGVMG